MAQLSVYFLNLHLKTTDHKHLHKCLVQKKHRHKGLELAREAEKREEAVTHFDIVPPVKDAGFPEEPGPKHAPLVKQVCHWISIL